MEGPTALSFQPGFAILSALVPMSVSLAALNLGLYIITLALTY